MRGNSEDIRGGYLCTATIEAILYWVMGVFQSDLEYSNNTHDKGYATSVDPDPTARVSRAVGSGSTLFATHQYVLSIYM